MTNITRKACTIIACILLVAVLFGVFTRASFYDNTNLDEYLSSNPMVEYCDMNYASDAELGFVDGQDINSLKDILNYEVIVVRGQLLQNTDRQIYQECVLSQFVVAKTYRGEVVEDIISILEPVDCSRDIMDYTDGYTLMKNSTEYVLFLKKLRNAGYGDSDIIYTPICTTFGKFENNENTPTKYIDKIEEEVSYTFDATSDAEIFVADEEAYVKYCRIKQEVYSYVCEKEIP